jgi:hypothetical protein
MSIDPKWKLITGHSWSRVMALWNHAKEELSRLKNCDWVLDWWKKDCTLLGQFGLYEVQTSWVLCFFEVLDLKIFSSLHFGRSRANQDEKKLHGGMEWDVILLFENGNLNLTHHYKLQNSFCFTSLRSNFQTLTNNFAKWKVWPTLEVKVRMYQTLNL